MLQDESKKEEDKFEFTAAGEAVGYISLDQARVLAIRHAQENRDFYGEPYAGRELVWEVMGSEESEDYYHIKLTYRPARRFRGRPGIELVTIDKTGSIELRQVLDQPVATRRAWFPISIVILVILGFGAVGGLFAGGVIAPSLVSNATTQPDTATRFTEQTGIAVSTPVPTLVSSLADGRYSASAEARGTVDDADCATFVLGSKKRGVYIRTTEALVRQGLVTMPAVVVFGAGAGDFNWCASGRDTAKIKVVDDFGRTYPVRSVTGIFGDPMTEEPVIPGTEYRGSITFGPVPAGFAGSTIKYPGLPPVRFELAVD